MLLLICSADLFNFLFLFLTESIIKVFQPSVTFDTNTIDSLTVGYIRIWIRFYIPVKLFKNDVLSITLIGNRINNLIYCL